MQRSQGTVIVTDHGFPSIERQREIVESAGFCFQEANPICRTEDDVIHRCSDADVLLVQWVKITRKVLEAVPRVRCIVRYGVGVDNFDLQAAKELNVVAANVPDYCLEEVSDHAMAMILSLVRRIPHDNAQIRRGEWGVGKFLPIRACSDLTLGLLGFGSIGRRVAAKARGFGFEIVACDPAVTEASFDQHEVKRVDFTQLLKTADVLSLHAPLLPGTRHIINRQALAAMKPGALLINTARGLLVREADLVDSLENGHLAGAALDVFETEPLPANSPLLSFDNVILTSHAASVSERAVTQLQVKAAGLARDFLLGKSLYSALNDR